MDLRATSHRNYRATNRRKYIFAQRGSKTYVLDACILRLEQQKDPQKLLPQAPEVPVTRSPRTIEQRRKLFQLRKQKVAKSFLAELDRKITNGQISKLTASAGGVKIVWNRRLRTTAGRARLRRKVLTDTQSPHRRYHNDAVIELADRLVNDENRLYNVVAHEFCHLANFMISNVTIRPHGPEFKDWGNKCTEMFKHLGVRVETTHSYT